MKRKRRQELPNLPVFLSTPGLHLVVSEAVKYGMSKSEYIRACLEEKGGRVEAIHAFSRYAKGARLSVPVNPSLIFRVKADAARAKLNVQDYLRSRLFFGLRQPPAADAGLLGKGAKRRGPSADMLYRIATASYVGARS